MIKKVFYLIIFLALAGCGYLKESQIIDNEQKFYFKGQTNLYQSNKSKKIIKKFYEFSNNENLARLNVKKKCLEYLNLNKLKETSCRYMGVKPTEKILTSIDQAFDGRF
tara:strand:+ start:302 stop:628 length:327 start_codon:yes stop_codon:yes gene_type:complete